ncbi:MAG: phosphatidic acid phosphatase, partial [Cyclobacteriaceae bacterium]
MKTVVICSLGILVLIIGSCTSANNGEYKEKAKNPEFLHRSMKAITDRIVHDIFSPPVASRIYSYVSVAAYEAAIQQDSSYRSLAGQLNGLEEVPKPDRALE